MKFPAFALRPRRRPTGRSLDLPQQRRIVAMIDAGETYDAIARKLHVTSAHIDCALRAHFANGRS